MGKDDTTVLLFEFFGVGNAPFSNLERLGKFTGFNQGILQELTQAHQPEMLVEFDDSFYGQIAENACKTGCRYTIELILTLKPGSFSQQAVECAFGYNYFDLGILILLELLRISLLNSTQIDSLLKSFFLSDLKMQSLQLELVQRGMISESNFVNFLSKYEFKDDLNKPENRFQERDKLFFHVAAADLLRNEVDKLINESSFVFIKNQPKKDIEKYLKYLSSAISLGKIDDSLVLHNRKGIIIKIDEILMSDLIGAKKGWQKILCIIQIFSSTGLLSLVDRRNIPGRYNINYQITKDKEPRVDLISKSEIKIIGKFEKVINDCKNDELFSTLEETYVLSLETPKIIDILHVKQTIKRYFKFFKAQYTKEKVKLKMNYQSIPQEHYELILDQFKIIHKIYKDKKVKFIDEIFIGKACGLLNLLMSVRMLFYDEKAYYKRFQFQRPRQEIDQPRSEAELPLFVRSVSGALRPSAFNNDDPPQEITNAFSTNFNFNDLDITVAYSSPEDYEDNFYDSDE